MMVDCELVLTVTEDGFERSVSGSARVHAFTGEKAGRCTLLSQSLLKGTEKLVKKENY